MEREFGEKSFNPTPFQFVTIFSGNYNREYRNLFSRKLPGQILMSAYYTPMTTRELAMELGVASVYLEDEIAMLEKYGFITHKSTGKYQTSLVIFTENFTNEFRDKAIEFAIPALARIVSSIQEKLGQIRKLNAICGKLSDNRLLWGVLWPVMCQGNVQFEEDYSILQEKDKLYDDTTGTNYGISNNGHDGDFGCDACAGYAEIDERYYVSAADFGVLPENNRYFANVDRTAFKEKLYKIVSGAVEPEFIILNEEEEKSLFEILSAAVSMMAELYNQLFSCACQLMYIHAPESIRLKIDRIVFQTLFSETVGLIGCCAIRCGSLVLPDFDGPVAMYVREKTESCVADYAFL